MSDLALAHESRYVSELREVLERVAMAGVPRSIDPDTVAAPGTWARGHTRRRGRCSGDRRGHRRHIQQRLLQRAPARPSRDARPGDGLLLLQQRRRRRAPRARRARPRARRDRRLRRPPRQRHRGHHRRRRARADGELLPAPALSVLGRGADGYQHDQRPGAAVHARPGDPRHDRGPLDGAARRLPAADDLRLGRVRRPSRRRTRPARPGRGRLRLDHDPDQGRRRAARAGPDRLVPRGRLQPRARSRAASRPTCASSWNESTVRPAGAQGAHHRVQPARHRRRARHPGRLPGRRLDRRAPDPRPVATGGLGLVRQPHRRRRAVPGARARASPTPRGSRWRR